MAVSSNSLTLDWATHRAVMITRAERRRATLEELANVGMALSKEIAIRMLDGPYHPELRHDPGHSFAATARSVRLTLTLEAKVDYSILALCDSRVDIIDTPKAQPATEPRRAVASAHSEPEIDHERLTDYERPDLPGAPPSPEVGKKDSRRPAASRVGGRREAGSPGELGDDEAGELRTNDNPERGAFLPPRSRPDGGSRPPHFGGGRSVTSADPPYLE